MTNYEIILQKLDRFIRKYYVNQIVKGTIISISLLMAVYLIAVTTEYYSQFSSSGRTFLFFGLATVLFFVIAINIVIPLLKIAKIGKTIDYRQASQIIQKHFKDVQDKLINTLELAQQNKGQANTLVLASIEQKTLNLKPVPFSNAINIAENRKYLKFLIPILLIFTGIYLYKPFMIKDSTQRILYYDKEFPKEIPFTIKLKNENLNVKKGENFKIQIIVEGKYYPQDVMIKYGGNNFIMNKKNNHEYTYDFRNINNSLQISFEAEEYQTETFEIKVLPAPSIVDFNIKVIPPAYTGIEPKIFQNVGNITVPAGSKLEWNIRTNQVDSLNIKINDQKDVEVKRNESSFLFNRTIMKDENYKLSVFNRFFEEKDILKYSVRVIPDLYPKISLEMMQDSVRQNIIYFKGNINDDYGFSKLTFNYQIKDQKPKSVKLDINRNITAQEYFYLFDFNSLKIDDQSQVSYFFTVWDNDRIVGAKSSKTGVYKYNIPSKQDLDSMTNAARNNIDKKMNEVNQLVDELQKDINQMQTDLINKKSSSWEQMSQINEISKKQEQINELMQDIKNEKEKINQINKEFNEQNKDLIEKQKQIDELLDNLINEDIKKLLEEIQKLKENAKPEDINKAAEQLKIDYKKLAEQLDRNMELLKRFEVTQNLEQIAEEMKENAQKQEQLSDKTEDRKADMDDVKEKQENIENEFERLEEKFNETLEKNKNLEEPMKLDSLKNDMNEIKKDFQEINQEISDGKNKKAAQKQNEAAQKMKEVSKKMTAMIDEQKKKENTENIQSMKQILENLVTFSYEQEDLMKEVKNTSKKDPKYVDLVNEQKGLKDDFEIINDSLNALSKRQPMVAKIIDDELGVINKNLTSLLTDMEERSVYRVPTQQQFIMTSANTLALLFDEVLQNMMNAGKPSGSPDGSENCKKPGNSQGEGMKKMQQMQKSLKQQLEQMLQMMKSGMKPGQMDEQLAKMLAQQEMLQKMLRDMKNGENISNETQQMLQEINNMMEETKRDIVNGNITEETLNRQKKIETRMLDAKNSMDERDFDEKRESNQANDLEREQPENIFEKQKKEKGFNENLRNTNLKLNYFYKNKYNEYLLKFNE